MKDTEELTSHFTEAVISSWVQHDEERDENGKLVHNKPDRIFSEYRYSDKLRAIRVEGPFSVEGRKQLETSEDGYLVIDKDGWGSAVDVDDFKKRYEKV